MSKGGFRAFRGSAATAESYLLERDSGLLDDYYREGQERTVEHRIVGSAGVAQGELSPAEFRAWMEHRDPETNEVRGVFRPRTFINSKGETEVGGTPLYQETIISVDKSLSLAAAANPRIAAALEAAMSRACDEAGRALHEHAVTRIGPKGNQRQVQFDALEFTSVQHTTSRAGDPHYHRHMQILPVGLVDGQWRAVDGATLYRLANRVNQAADLAISRDAQLRQIIAEEGYLWQPGPAGGVVAEFVPLVDDYSQRRDQIAVNREAADLEWRMAHPGEEPGPKQEQAWDQLGWAQDRPTKEPAIELTPEAVAARVGEVAPTNTDRVLYGQTADQIDPEVIAQAALDQLSQSRSAWSRADMLAAVDRQLAETYLIGDAGVPELQQAALGAVLEQSVSFFDEGVKIEGVRHYTSIQVIEADEEITQALALRTITVGESVTVEADRDGFTLSVEQLAAAEAISGTHELVVVQGAAGAGKTTMLEAARDAISEQGRHMVVVSPTKRGALEAGDVLNTQGDSVHALLYRAGAYINEDTGAWVLPEQWRAQPEAFRMDEHTVLVVDEAGMLDQDTARALHTYIDAHRVGSLVLTGDSAQLSAVGRGGYFARATQISTISLDLTDVRRFRTRAGHVDEEYAAMSLRMRDREDPDDVFDALKDRGLVSVGTAEELRERVAETIALEHAAGETSIAITATNAAAQQINHAVFERLVAAGQIDTSTTTQGRDGDPIAAGAVIATRQNDRELGVANRQTWTVTHVCADGRITVKDDSGHHRTLPAGYVSENVQLAYAVTGHGAQGMTKDTAHTVLSDEMDAAGAYVGLTRGRYANTLHTVAVDHEDAREQFVAAFERNAADLGVEEARRQAEQDVAGLTVGDAALVAEEHDRLKQVAEQAEHKATQAEQQATQLEQKVTEFEQRAEPIRAQYEKFTEQATEQLHTAESRQADWEEYAAQLEAEGAQHALRDGRDVLDAKHHTFQARTNAQNAGMLTRRGLEKEHQAAQEQWEQRREDTLQKWGSEPHYEHDLEAWAQRAGTHYPPAQEARATVETARENVAKVQEQRTQIHKQERTALTELRRETLGTYQARTILSTAEERVLDEDTALKWVDQHRQNAQAHRMQAVEARTEAEVLQSMPVEAAAQRVSELIDQTEDMHTPEHTPQRGFRTDEVLRQLQQQRAIQEQQRDRGIEL